MPARVRGRTDVYSWLQALRNLGLSLDSYAAYGVALDIVFATLYAAVAVVIFWRKSDKRMALLASFALFTSGTAGLPNAMYALSVEHASLWWPVSLLNFLGTASFGLFLYRFPDNRFVPGWARWIVFAWIAWQVPKYWFPRWDSYDLHGLQNWVAIAVWTAFLGTMIYAQAYRYWRVSSTMERQQIKWVVFGISAAALAYLGIVVALSPFSPAPTTASATAIVFVGYTFLYSAMLLIPLAIGFAILRHRLFDIDLIINRTLVYGALTTGVVGLYVLVVGSVGVVVQVRGNLLLSILAAGLVAVLFQPLRERLQRAVNHLMYGKRDDPYTVLSQLGERLEARLAPDTALSTIVDTVAGELKLPYVAISLEQDGDFVTAAAHGDPVSDPIVLPLSYQSAQVGRLIFSGRVPGETFSDPDRKLLEDLARQAAVTVYAARLNADLQKSRERLVTAREEERRRLRRDLHDGLGPRLAAQSLKAGSARLLYERDAEAADGLLSDLESDIEATLSEIRRLVYVLRPPTLDELGLVGALRDTAERHTSQTANGLEVLVHAPDELPPLSAAVEVAAHRIAQEALANVTRHAAATECLVRSVARGLVIEISDNGSGIPEEHRSGVGLLSMRERAEELGESLFVDRASAGGTRVLARLPLPDHETLTPKD